MTLVGSPFVVLESFALCGVGGWHLTYNGYTDDTKARFGHWMSFQRSSFVGLTFPHLTKIASFREPGENMLASAAWTSRAAQK